MLEWLNVSTSTQAVSLPNLIVRLFAALLAGLIVAFIATRGSKRSSDKTLPLTLVMMSILIAMATQIIGDNIARAFSLVGALSIVRFRTAVSEARDVAFVLSSVVVGMALGAEQWLIAGCGLVFVAIANQTMTTLLPPGQGAKDPISTLTIRTGIGSPPLSDELLLKYCDSFELQSTSTSRKGASMNYVYHVQLKPEISQPNMLLELNGLPEIEGVSWGKGSLDNE